MFTREGTLFFFPKFAFYTTPVPPPPGKEASKQTHQIPGKPAKSNNNDGQLFFFFQSHLFPPSLLFLSFLPFLPPSLPPLAFAHHLRYLPILTPPYRRIASHHITICTVLYCTVRSLAHLPTSTHHQSIQLIIPYHHIPPPFLSPFFRPHMHHGILPFVPEFTTTTTLDPGEAG
ncbi:hypothetical protein B9Z19DRAFT_620327 [Tuber borchii]|uniref:Uncharacterized protein n=1 Tax=Tuber borchii TaxID=42251 RepID=A0A2T6ZBC2_TUBBO|nr:hypothetical protein B9Z19DRAFT_620327 [Tuber borchii]